MSPDATPLPSPDPITAILLMTISARTVEFLATVAATVDRGNRPAAGLSVELSAHGVTVTVVVSPPGR